MSFLHTLGLVLCVLSVRESVAQNINAKAFNALQYVDQLIGSTKCGNVFAGATLPYGMAKVVADTDTPGCNQGGFTTDGDNVTGFGLLHDSGTGGASSLGNFALFPYNYCPGGTVDGCTFPKTQRKIQYIASSVNTAPGYFGITLVSGVSVDMTATQHTALLRFNFSGAGNQNPLILLDLTDLSDSRQDNATISVDSTTGRMTGQGSFIPSYGSGEYTLHFCADFSGAGILDNGIFVNSRADATVKSLQISRGIEGNPLPGGAFVRFQPPGSNSVLARVGVSYISSDQACTYATNEIPSFDFTSVQNAATNAWQAKLAPITVATTGGVDKSILRSFYSGIYRTMVNPQNYTGENVNWQSSEPYFDSFYCLWDSFRSQLPFLTILDPNSVTQMVRSLIDTYRHIGWLPDCRMSQCKGFTQGGSNADNVLADAYVKNLTGGISWSDAYAAVVKDAEVEPYDWSVEGRGGLDSWHNLGYIPAQDFDYKGFGIMTRSISRTLEYSYNDFCVATLASGQGNSADAAKYNARSGNWKNLFKSDQTSYTLKPPQTDTGFKGFFQPKFLNGTWGFQDPLMCSYIDKTSKNCGLQVSGPETFESSIWEYSFFVPHDQASLITSFGGPTAFVNRLNYLHDQKVTYIGNEPAFLTVFQYHYAGRPALSAVRAHYYIPGSFKATHGGLPGNDDSGAMGSFVAFSMIGLFPNPGQNVYLIIPPFFESVNITSPLTGNTARIRNINYDSNYGAIYIQSATLNGQPYTKNWIDHSFFTEGKELVLTLGTTESTWGTATADLPPSLGLGGAS